MFRTLIFGVFVFFAIHTASATAAERRFVSALDLAEIRDIGGGEMADIAVSPDRKWIAFQLQEPDIENNAYTTTWWVVPTDGSREAKAIADGGDVILNPQFELPINGSRPAVLAKWSPDSGSFAYTVLRDGRREVWISRPDREGQRQLTQHHADIIDFFWSQDGGKIYFEAARDPDDVKLQFEEESDRGFLFDDRTRLIRGPHPDQQHCGYIGNVAAQFAQFKSLRRSCEPALWVHSLRSGTERRVDETTAARLIDGRRSYLFGTLGDTPPTTPEAIEGRDIRRLSVSDDEGRYAWLENADPESYAGLLAPVILHAMLDDSTIRRCPESACQMFDMISSPWIAWHGDGEEIVFLRREGYAGSRTGLYAWNPTVGSLRTILRTEDRLESCKSVGSGIACLHESWTTPRKLVRISLDSGAMTTLHDPNANITHRGYPRVEKLEWHDAFGSETAGHLVYPVDYDPGRAYPLVIVTYQSRGFLRGGVGDEYPIYPLATEGFFVLSYNNPKDWEGLGKAKDTMARAFDDSFLQRSVLSSQEAIVSTLVERGLVDERRVAITGLSQGAMQTMYGLLNSETFAVGIASSSSFNATLYYLMSSQQRRSYRRWLKGTPDAPGSYWNQYSIGYQPERVDAPLLINISDSELLGSVENYVRLKDAGKPIEMYVFRGEYHIKWRPVHRLNIYRRNIQWLKFWLQNEEAEDPVSPGQYERWRKMRAVRCAQADSDLLPYCGAV